MVERLAVNEDVVGSIPTSGAMIIKIVRQLTDYFNCLSFSIPAKSGLDKPVVVHFLQFGRKIVFYFIQRY